MSFHQNRYDVICDAICDPLV